MKLEDVTKEIGQVVQQYLKELDTNEELDTIKELLSSYKNHLKGEEAELLNIIKENKEDSLKYTTSFNEGKLEGIRECLYQFILYFVED